MPIGVRKGNTVHMDVQQSGPSSRGVTTEEARQHLGDPLPQSADAIDRVVRLAPRWLVVTLIACALLVVATVVWAFAGTVTQSVGGPAIYDDSGYRLVRATAPEVIAKVAVAPGQPVAAGAPLVTFTDGSTAVSPLNGSVVSIFVSEGATVIKDKALVGVTDESKPDTVAVLLPPEMVGRISVGLPAQIEVSSAPASVYGYLRGTVAQFSSTPKSIDQLQSTLDMERQTVSAALGDKPGVLVQVRLVPDASTPSRYSWTIGQGPPFAIAEGTSASGTIILSEQRPIDTVFPGVRGGTGGAGQ